VPVVDCSQATGMERPHLAGSLRLMGRERGMIQLLLVPEAGSLQRRGLRERNRCSYRHQQRRQRNGSEWQPAGNGARWELAQGLIGGHCSTRPPPARLQTLAAWVAALVGAHTRPTPEQKGSTAQAAASNRADGFGHRNDRSQSRRRRGNGQNLRAGRRRPHPGADATSFRRQRDLLQQRSRCRSQRHLASHRRWDHRPMGLRRRG